MSMMSILTATISLIAKNCTTLPGIVIIIIGILMVYYNVQKLIRDRDPYRIIYVLLLVVLAAICLASSQEIRRFVMQGYMWIRSKF